MGTIVLLAVPLLLVAGIGFWCYRNSCSGGPEVSQDGGEPCQEEEE